MWARVCIDVDDDQKVIGYSAEVHDGDELTDVIVWPVPVDVSAFDVLQCALADLHRRYGTQLALELF
jgi:hypothetical protein